MVADARAEITPVDAVSELQKESGPSDPGAVRLDALYKVTRAGSQMLAEQIRARHNRSLGTAVVKKIYVGLYSRSRRTPPGGTALSVRGIVVAAIKPARRRGMVRAKRRGQPVRPDSGGARRGSYGSGRGAVAEPDSAE